MKIHVFLSVKPDFLSRVAEHLKIYLPDRNLEFSISASLPYYLELAQKNLSPIYSEIDFYTLSIDSRKVTNFDIDWLDEILQNLQYGK